MDQAKKPGENSGHGWSEHAATQRRMAMVGEKIKVSVLAIKHLPKADLMGKCDPYCIVKCAGKSFKTEVKQKAYDAEYQDVFEFPFLEIEAGCCELSISVFDCNRFSQDARIGEAALRLSPEAFATARHVLTCNDSNGQPVTGHDGQLTEVHLLISRMAPQRRKDAHNEHTHKKHTTHTQPKAKRRRLHALTNVVCALLKLNRKVWQRREDDRQNEPNAKEMYRTSGGTLRLRDLPMCPLSIFADEMAREEVCEIVPGVYQSNWKGAEKWPHLEALGITHVVSTLEPDGNPFPQQITYLNLEFEDDEDVDVLPHLDTACCFMKLALTSKNGQGRCLVHCAAGVSRSSTITIAFLVRECHFSLREAFDLLRERRPICWPNAGFMRGLIAFEARIHSGRTSLDIAEYETWTNVNSEAVIFAKRVDRDREAAR